jgi:hypothetical protein
MKKISKLILIAVGSGILTVALSLVPRKPAGAAGSAPVTVTNTPLPVTLQGTGSIAGNVSASQSGAWNVGISNAGTSPVPVRDMDNAAKRLPFQLFLFVLLHDGGTGTPTRLICPRSCLREKALSLSIFQRAW